LTINGTISARGSGGSGRSGGGSVVVDLTPEGVTGGLQVVRVLSEKLIPINFGYGSEHRGHPRMAMVGCSWGEEYPSIPHFFT
jgi:hypothetical protein